MAVVSSSSLAYRGPIVHLEYKVSYGQLEVSKEKCLLAWIIGERKLLVDAYG